MRVVLVRRAQHKRLFGGGFRHVRLTLRHWLPAMGVRISQPSLRYLVPLLFVFDVGILVLVPSSTRFDARQQFYVPAVASLPVLFRQMQGGRCAFCGLRDAVSPFAGGLSGRLEVR